MSTAGGYEEITTDEALKFPGSYGKNSASVYWY